MLQRDNNPQPQRQPPPQQHPQPLPRATARGVETGSYGTGSMRPPGDDEGERPMKGRRRTEQDNGDKDNGTDNARDGTSGGEDGMNEDEGTTGTRTRGQQQRGQGDSNGNDDDPSTRPCRCKRLFAGGKRVLMDG